MRAQMQSVYILEACLLAMLCDNGAELFALRPLQPFKCRYNASALAPLVLGLLAPAEQTSYWHDGLRRV